LGIKGEGLSFSSAEKTTAHKENSPINIGHIGTFAGNIGSQFHDQSSMNVTQTSTSSLDLDAIRALALQINEYADDLPAQSCPAIRRKLNELDGELISAVPDESKLRSMLGSIKNVLEGAAGNLVASGILAELAKILSH